MLYETHWKGIHYVPLRREKPERTCSTLCHRLLRYWAEALAQRRQSYRLYRQIRKSTASRKLNRDRGDCIIPPRYVLIARKRWEDNYRGAVFPVGAHVWYKAQDALWWLGNNSAHVGNPTRFMVWFFDDRGPIKIALDVAKYNVPRNADTGLWRLQTHRSGTVREPHAPNGDVPLPP